MMDENQFGPNINTTPEMAHTLVGKAVPLQLQAHGFSPQWGQSVGPQIGSGAKWNFFWLFCALMLSPLFGNPENAGVMSHFRSPVGPAQGGG